MDLEIVDVRRGENECLVLKVVNDCNLWPYLLLDTTFDDSGMVSNINRHVYIFENYNVSSGDFVVIFSQKGKNRHFVNKTGSKTHAYYWGYEDGVNIWNGNGDKALLIKASEFKITRL